MFVCADCYTVCDGQEMHPNQAQCDEFDGLETVEAVVPEADVNDIRDLYGAVAILSASIAELQRQFDAIVAAVVKAASPEEER